MSRGLKRNPIDKFYTTTPIVSECISYVKSKIDIDKNDLIIEPSAGNGAFIDSIKSLSNHYKFYDIQPEHKEIIKQDFLELDFKFVNDYKKVHVIGNPPFGKQSSTAIRFIKKCCEFANTISFILPKSFKKDSMIKVFHPKFHLLFQVDLKPNSFLQESKECNVPTIFQIWEKKSFDRVIPKKLIPINYKFVKKYENPDISFRRIGVYAGKISTEIEDKSEQSHYFIKFMDDESIDNIILKLSNIKFEFNNTVGPKSISKGELIKEFNKILSD
jgi:predicted RNA methylase